MPFKVKDLMIDLSAQKAPQLPLCRIGCTRVISYCLFTCSGDPTVNTCRYFESTIVTCRYGITNITCIGGSCGFSEDTIDTIDTIYEDPTQVSALKEKLKSALEKVEAHEKTVAENLKPQTVADVEMLETKLNEALAELKSRKTELQKKAGK